MSKEHIGLNKYISSSGFCSRREADKLIEQARVTINGELVMSSLPVLPGDLVEVDGEPIHKTKVRPIYIAFNKPAGITSTTDPKDRSNIISYINHTKRIFPIGRLDKDSDGLIFLTNDGDIVNKILRASNHHEKEYIVHVDKAVTPEFIKQMSNGVPVLDTVTKKCYVRQEGSRRFRIILTQGLNRQIRRMCEYLDYKVVELKRVRIMNVELGTLAVGKWRYLTLPEIDKLNELVAESSKVDNSSKKVAKNTVPKNTPAPVIKENKISRAEEAELQAWIEKVERPKGMKKSTYADFREGAKKREKKDSIFEEGRKPRRIASAEAGKGGKAVVRGRGKADAGKSKIAGRNVPGADTRGKKGGGKGAAAKGAPAKGAAPKGKPGSKTSSGKPKGKEVFAATQTQNVRQYIPRRK